MNGSGCAGPEEEIRGRRARVRRRVVSLPRWTWRRGGWHGRELHSTWWGGLNDLSCCPDQPIAAVLAELQAVGVLYPAAITPSHTLKGNPAGTIESRELSRCGRASRPRSAAGLGPFAAALAWTTACRPGQASGDPVRPDAPHSSWSVVRNPAGRESPGPGATTLPAVPGFPWLFPAPRCVPGRTPGTGPPVVGLRCLSSHETRTGGTPAPHPPPSCC